MNNNKNLPPVRELRTSNLSLVDEINQMNNIKNNKFVISPYNEENLPPLRQGAFLSLNNEINQVKASLYDIMISNIDDDFELNLEFKSDNELL